MGIIIHQLIGLMSFVVRIYTIIIIIRAVVSWVQPNPYSPIVQMLYRLTEPVLVRIRKALDTKMGNMGIDYSPIVAIVLLNVLVAIVRWMLLPLA